ncbi:hypothetical protein FGG08_003052 [Glutinoglossum americanum]|uniref:S-formylglutathione hydrolase n=1 Tax=Glutinoglossum americanum TaxID=1670608 RepID=A0A9P8IAH5_9PEZI|nr:hypothetical protein FGG08_003052 [Glutinoglossum americanum]
MSDFKTIATIASFGGKLLKLTHNASTTGCEMALNLYLPPQAQGSKKVPVLLYLSGLTCTGDNCAEKGFFQHGASQKGIAIVYPDTSPRGLKIEGEDDSYDFGSGAGFYIDATQTPWNTNYKMYSYIASELPTALFSHFPQLDAERVSITGHSMGGHGALTLFLKNSKKYKSVSAFAPISNPINCPWGQKAFAGYFGKEQQEKWREHDATELVRSYKGALDLLIDVVRHLLNPPCNPNSIALNAQKRYHEKRLPIHHPTNALSLFCPLQGTGDNFYKQGQLLPENFAAAAKEAGNDKGLNLRYHPVGSPPQPYSQVEASNITNK